MIIAHAHETVRMRASKQLCRSKTMLFCLDECAAVRSMWGQRQDHFSVFEEKEAYWHEIALFVHSSLNISDRVLGKDRIYQQMRSIHHRPANTRRTLIIGRSLSDAQSVRDRIVIECAEHVEDVVVRLQNHLCSLQNMKYNIELLITQVWVRTDWWWGFTPKRLNKSIVFYPVHTLATLRSLKIYNYAP